MITDTGGQDYPLDSKHQVKYFKENSMTFYTT